MITYNQEKFIAGAIEGVLGQKTNFPFRLYIGDDTSSDCTSEIIKSYVKKFPHKIAYIRNERNLGMQPNFIRLNSLARSKYIAMCEGDDYWTDENKLQKQIDFLEANPNYAICFHAVNTLSNGIEKPSALNRSDKEEAYSILDLAQTNIMHTPSVVFRNGLFEKFPDWFSESPVGDYVLHLLNAKKGLIKYFPETMAVYRVHNTSTWGQHDIGTNHPKWLWLLNRLLTENFEAPVIKKLSEQKNKTFCEYITWLLYRKQHHLIKDSYHKFYEKGEDPGIDILVDLFTKTISNLHNELDEIKSRKVYKAGSKLSYFKYKYSKLLTKK